MNKWFSIVLINGIFFSSLISCSSINRTVCRDNVIKSQQYSLLPLKTTKTIDSLIRSLPQGSEVGLSIYNLTKHKSIYTYRDKLLSRPASTMKLLTTITTLSYEKGRLPFTTEIWYSGNIVKDTLQGNIFIKGTMDPEFDDAAMDYLVAKIKKLPFKIIHGQIIGDVSMKDSLYWGSGWMWDDAPYDYQPQLTPLILHKGTVTITATPDSINKPATIMAVPKSDYYTLVNQTKSNASETNDFRVSRDWFKHSNQITISGTINKPHTENITVSSVPDFFLQTFKQRLQASGINLIGSCNYTYNRVDYSCMNKIGEWSTDCQSVVNTLLKQSDNLNAEAMFYRLAGINNPYPATAQKGIDEIRKRIQALGLNPDNYNLADGSGLSNYDCLSPELEVAFLRYAYSQPEIFSILYPALPIAGTDGSLKRRMQHSIACKRVHAKTGSYTAINCLAGYITTIHGEQFAFSIMNQNIFSPHKAQAFQNEICNILCKQ